MRVWLVGWLRWPSELGLGIFSVGFWSDLSCHEKWQQFFFGWFAAASLVTNMFQVPKMEVRKAYGYGNPRGP